MWIDWQTHSLDLLRALIEHIDLTLSALGIALTIALPVGFLVSKSRLLSDTVMTMLGAIYTIPSMALLALLVPVTGLGMRSALIALVLYAQFILIRNIVLGFRSLDPHLIESARGMGMDAAQLFWQVELPLALPMILGGVRITAVAIAGMATLAAWINAGGLGTILFEGIYQNDWPKIGSGTLITLLFSLSLNRFLLSLEQDALSHVRGEFG